MPACVWIHTVSLGEAIAATPLIMKIHQHHPNKLLLITTTTPTGAAWVNKQFKTMATHAYLPYDHPYLIKRFFRHFKPSIGIIMETELWPNTLHLAKKHAIPMLLANARLSERAFARYKRIPNITNSMLNQLDKVLIQSESIAERFFALGLNKTKASITGNLKFNAHIPDNITEAHQKLNTMMHGAPCWIAASTHSGEESVILDAHINLLEKLPHCKLILAPRHPERCTEVALLLNKKGLSWQRYTPKKSRLSESILLIDTIGELMPCFAASKIAFIGGSLVPRGGHNLIEPLLFSLPVLTGPHTFNFSDIHQMIKQAGLCTTVHDAQSLSEAVFPALEHIDPTFKSRCQSFMANHLDSA